MQRRTSSSAPFPLRIAISRTLPSLVIARLANTHTRSHTNLARNAPCTVRCSLPLGLAILPAFCLEPELGITLLWYHHGRHSLFLRQNDRKSTASCFLFAFLYAQFSKSPELNALSFACEPFRTGCSSDARHSDRRWKSSPSPNLAGWISRAEHALLIAHDCGRLPCCVLFTLAS